MRHSKRFKNKKQFEETRKRIESGVPLGFKSRQQARVFGSSVQGHLKSAGIKKARVALTGSAVTGRKHRRETGRWDGDPFDAGRKSDFDFAIVSRELLVHRCRQVIHPTAPQSSATLRSSLNHPSESVH
ncbi:MAG: hypothetical protein IIB63_12825 [Proteobacteria bacterium]|nr:hypothetical protein [Pseudomonadota bacterium]